MELQTDNLGKVSVTIEKDYWDINKDYDKLTIVQVQDKYKTYISRKPVPAGAVLTDREYWIPFSSLKEDIILDYNAFTDKYGKDLIAIKNHIKEIDEALKDFAQNVVLHEKGKPNGLASLNGSGKIPSEQLPSYVDDVLEYDTFDNIPEEGESDKIYVINDTNKAYRWSGSKYIEVSPTEGIVYLGTFNSEDELYNYCCTEAVRNSEISLFTYKIPSNFNDINYLMGGIMTQGYSDDGFIVQTFKHSSVKYSRYIDRHTGRIEVDLYPVGLSDIIYDSINNKIILHNEFETVSECTIPVATINDDGLLSKSDYKKIQYIDILKKLVEVNDIFSITYNNKQVSPNIPIITDNYNIGFNFEPTINDFSQIYNLTNGFKFKIFANVTSKSYYNENYITRPNIYTLYEKNDLVYGLPRVIKIDMSDCLANEDNKQGKVRDIYDITFILELYDANGANGIKFESKNYTIIRGNEQIPTSINLLQYINNYSVTNKFISYFSNTKSYLNKIQNIQQFNSIDYIRKQATLYLGKYENGKMKLSPISDKDKRILKSGISIEKYLTETNKKDYDVWLKLPTFFYKCESDNEDDREINYKNKLTIITEHIYYTSLNEGDEENWNKWDGNTLIGVYKASLVDNNLHSLPNEIPVTDKSQKQFKELSRSRGNGFRLITYDVHKMLALLFFSTSSDKEFGSYGYNSQAICGRGTKNEINSVYYPKKTGLCDYLGKTDTNAINGTGDENPISENIMKGYGDGIKSVNFLGLENIYGDICEFMDDIYVMQTRDAGSTTYNKYMLEEFVGKHYYPIITHINTENTLTQDELETFSDYKTFIGIYKKDGELLERIIDLNGIDFEGYIRKLLYSKHADVIPIKIDIDPGASNYNDYFTAYNPGHVFIRSNSSNYTEGGMTCLIGAVDEDMHSTEYGTRLIYEGTDETIEFTDDI